MDNRRNFLKKLTMLSTAVWAPSFLVRTVRAAQRSGMTRAGLGNPNRILLVCELAGGCDGLNTVVPFGDDAYLSARPTLALRESQGLLKLDDRFALHPAMTGFRELWDGEMAIVHGVGYPNPNRSHFRSRDIWHTAEPEAVASDGWLANYFEELGGDGLRGLNIGGRVPRAMVSASGSSPSIQNIDTYQLITDPKYAAVDGANKNAAFQALLSGPHNQFPFEEYVTETVLDATLSSIELLEGQQNYNSTIEYPNTAFARNLRTIAQIIAAEIGVTVFYTTLGGFDTHANQVVGNASANGVHATLLGDLSQGLKAFLDDMKEMGRGQDVVVMTFSEFGRRLRENGSLGTDHGTANQMFLLGGSVRPGMYGEQPSLAPADLDPVGDMVHNVDFRSVYASVLANWLGADAAEILGGDFGDPRLSFF